VDSGNDLLMNSGGTPWAKWHSVGDAVIGTVLALPVIRQSRDFDSGEPDFWSNGDPKMEVVVRIATDLRDPEIDDDDGTRAVVLPVGSQRFQAVQKAVKRAGASGIEVGGTLTIVFDSEKKHEKHRMGYNPIKQFTAKYIAPPPSEETGDLLDQLAPPF
jgi:hypothetical protein